MVIDPYEQVEEAIETTLNISLNPRGPEMLLDYVTESGLDTSSTALDLGCNTGKYTFELNRRFGCRVIGVDPDEHHIAEATASVKRSANGESEVTFKCGQAEVIPADDDSFDLVLCRDVLELVADLSAAYGEIRRVLTKSGRAIIYTMCATELLEEREADTLFKGLSDIKVTSMQPEAHENAIRESGLRISHREILGAEWGEFDEEHSGKPGRWLLQVARLMRNREEYSAQFGRENYEVAVADRLWHVYRMIGKLSGRIYLLDKLDG
jgi:SAM-dependent methyltransferase